MFTFFQNLKTAETESFEIDTLKRIDKIGGVLFVRYDSCYSTASSGYLNSELSPLSQCLKSDKVQNQMDGRNYSNFWHLVYLAVFEQSSDVRILSLNRGKKQGNSNRFFNPLKVIRTVSYLTFKLEFLIKSKVSTSKISEKYDIFKICFCLQINWRITTYCKTAQRSETELLRKFAIKQLQNNA